MLEENSFLLIMLLLSTALGLSFLIERFLEFINGWFKKYVFSDLDRVSQNADGSENESSGTGDEEDHASIQHAPILFALDALPPRQSVETIQTVLLQVLGVLAGIGICFWAQFGLFEPLGAFAGISNTLDWILTGVLIGGGSQPIHFLIEFLNQRRVPGSDTSSGILPVFNNSGVIVDLEDEPVDPFFKILDIPYEGGYRPASLENRNIRPAPPDLIVFHHTAMHSDATFADVVREIVEVKGWSTGYHTVIAPNGKIHNFCRWDRTGVHALGVNQRSLGIALMGNFHSAPGDPFSNDQGQFGITQPTDLQLLSAAKVVALWCHLFNLPVSFGTSIVAHREVRPTACAGSNFPYDSFAALVENCYTSWRSHEAQTELIFYKQKQRIYSNR